MLQAHSLLWHYLWAAPNVFLLGLAIALVRRGLQKQYPVFLVFAVGTAIAQLTVYITDISPAVSADDWWKIFWAVLLVEATLKFFLFGEVFGRVFLTYPSIARTSAGLFRSVGILLVLTAVVLAARAPQDGRFGIISGAHFLEQTIYFVESGLLAVVFLLCGYFRLRLARPVLGICLGLAISGCMHLAILALVANGGLPNSQRIALDFVNMATYHACVLIWCYYLLVPQKVTVDSSTALPEHSLEVWNRELERLLQ